MDRQLGTGNEPGIEKEGVGNAISFELVQLFDERACRNPTQLVRSLHKGDEVEDETITFRTVANDLREVVETY
jgi:hypothetical protein